jgi:hypothetical protein
MDCVSAKSMRGNLSWEAWQPIRASRVLPLAKHNLQDAEHSADNNPAVWRMKSRHDHIEALF